MFCVKSAAGGDQSLQPTAAERGRGNNFFFFKLSSEVTFGERFQTFVRTLKEPASLFPFSCWLLKAFVSQRAEGLIYRLGV